MKGLDHVINCDFNKSLNPKQAYWVLLPVSYLRRVCPVCRSGATLMASSCAFCLQMLGPKQGELES